MGMIDSITGMATAMSQARLQTDVATRVLKLAQGQNQTAADLLEDALQNAEEVISGMAEGVGENVDTSA
jgi:predicted transcriptional regulator